MPWRCSDAARPWSSFQGLARRLTRTQGSPDQADHLLADRRGEHRQPRDLGWIGRKAGDPGGRDGGIQLGGPQADDRDRDGNRQGDAAVVKEQAKTGSLSFRDFASVEVSGTRCPAARQRSIASDLADDLTMLWAGAGQRRARLADPGSSLCWQPSAAVPTVGRCVEEPQHQRGDKLRIIGDRDVAQTG
jgi:hypothetical protein